MANAKNKPVPASAAPSANEVSAETEAREPVTVRGTDLLKLIAAKGGMYLTQDEGQQLAEAGYVSVNMDDVQGNAALVTLTEAGAALIAAPAPKEKPVFEIDDYVPPMPQKKRGGKRGSKYPFDKLEVGKSFHVPKTKDMPDPVSALASSLTGARRRYETPLLVDGKEVVETVKVKTYAKDANGKRIKGADGKFVVSGETTVSKTKMVHTRDFQVVEAAADDPRGPGARVTRTK